VNQVTLAWIACQLQMETLRRIPCRVLISDKHKTNQEHPRGVRGVFFRLCRN
jgi:hypothetical protein